MLPAGGKCISILKCVVKSLVGVWVYLSKHKKTKLENQNLKEKKERKN